MKKVLVVLLIISVLLSMVACGASKQVAEKYCWNCGEGISKEVSFCEHCGASVKNNQDETTANTDTTDNSTLSTEDNNTTETPSSTQTPADTQKPTEAQKPTETQKPTESQTPAETQKPAESQKPTETQKPTEPQTPTHTHSYTTKTTSATCTQGGYTTHTCACGDSYTDNHTSAKGHNYTKKVTNATCSSKGYTTYTCSCGDSYVADYTNTTAHSYSKYVCTVCGVVDRSNAYAYLVEWVKNNGRTSGDNITYIIQQNSSQKFTLSYSTKYNNLFVDYYMNPGSATEAYAMIQLDSYFYGFSFYGDTLYGYVNAATYTQSSSLTYSSCDCQTFTPDRLLSLAKTSVDLLIESLLNCLLTNNLPISLSDLGFKSY